MILPSSLSVCAQSYQKPVVVLVDVLVLGNLYLRKTVLSQRPSPLIFSPLALHQDPITHFRSVQMCGV